MKRPSAIQVKNGTYRYVRNGSSWQWYKRCTGPAHEEPEYLPATEKYFHFHKSGKDRGNPVARCRLCINWSKIKSNAPGSYQGLVPISIAAPFFFEAINRIGATELARRSGVSRRTIYKATHALEGNIQKSVLRKIMLELTSIQRKNERSISNGAKWRAERAANHGHDVCNGCGTPKTNFTVGCLNCRNRIYDQFKRGQISASKWHKYKEQLRQ